MSLIFDKGKRRFSDIEKIKQKKKLNYNSKLLKKNVKTNFGNNSQLFNEYENFSPFRNINNNKKNVFLATFQNNSSLASNNKEFLNIQKKKKIAKNLKYNKSFEGNILNSDLKYSKNFDFGNDDLYTNPYRKNIANQNFNNKSVILNNKQKAKIKNRNNKSVSKSINSNLSKNNKTDFIDNLIVTKLDDKFRSLEENIIDKQYENDIDHDEIIISNKKTHLYFTNTERIRTSNKKIKNLKLSDVLDDENNNKNENYNDDKNEIYFLNIFSNKNNIDFDEKYLLNTSFENNRNDFDIMYNDNYEESVKDDLLSLEIRLLIEKMIEIQKSYHKEFNLFLSHYNRKKLIFNILAEKIKSFQKKIFLLRKMKEIKNIKGNIYNFLGVYNHNNHFEINKINKNELSLWKNILYKKDKRFNKEILKDIFKKVIFDKYYKISGKLDNIENQIIINLMKKFKYTIKIKNNRGIENMIANNNKIIATSASQRNKNIIKQNKNIIKNINKKSHQKTSSYIQANHNNYIYFKNSKLK